MWLSPTRANVHTADLQFRRTDAGIATPPFLNWPATQACLASVVRSKLNHKISLRLRQETHRVYTLHIPVRLHDWLLLEVFSHHNPDWAHDSHIDHHSSGEGNPLDGIVASRGPRRWTLHDRPFAGQGEAIEVNDSADPWFELKLLVPAGDFDIESSFQPWRSSTILWTYPAVWSWAKALRQGRMELEANGRSLWSGISMPQFSFTRFTPELF